MKSCPKCKQELNENEVFCTNCGYKLEKQKRKEGLGTASLIIGIIALVFSFILNILILPLAIIGLILGIVNKVKHGKKISGIILNSVSIVVSIIVFIILVVVLSYAVFDYVDSTIFKEDNTNTRYNTSNNIYGIWKCKIFRSI